MSQPDTFVIVDGNSLMHRAFHALPPLSNEDGVFTNAVFGFLSMLFKVIGDEQPISGGGVRSSRADLPPHGLQRVQGGAQADRAGIEAAVRPRARMPDENGGQNPDLPDL